MGKVLKGVCRDGEEAGIIMAVILDKSEVANILYATFNNFIDSNEFPIRVILADDQYLPVDIAWVINFIETDPILSPDRYTGNIFDCDDYVLYLKTKTGLFAQKAEAAAPFALGFLFTQKHAFNLCIDENRQVHLINTQSDNRASTAEREAFATFLKIGNSNTIQIIYL
jgi:hypothetical protein